MKAIIIIISKILTISMFTFIGLIVGYFIFAKDPILGKYIDINTLLGINTNDTFLEEIVINAIIEPIKQNIYISGAIGSVLGIVIAVFKK